MPLPPLLPPLPPLPTLNEKASWTNRAGRLDRAACAELRASEVWRETREALHQRDLACNIKTLNRRGFELPNRPQ